MRMRMLIGVIIVIILLLILMLLAGAALLLSTGSPPKGEISGVYGLVYSIEAFLAEMIAGAAEWAEYIASQIARLSTNILLVDSPLQNTCSCNY
jgi:hypothetical protein